MSAPRGWRAVIRPPTRHRLAAGVLALTGTVGCAAGSPGGNPVETITSTAAPEPDGSTSVPTRGTEAGYGDVTLAPPVPTADGPACLDSLTVRQRVALLVWPAVYSNDWESAKRVVDEHGVGGVLLMRPRLSDHELTANIAALDDASDIGVLVATDEEGGNVQRLRDIERLPSQYDVSQTLTPSDAERLVAGHAELVARLGVDVVLGPVVDVLPTDTPPALQRSRFFDGDAQTVARFAAAYVTAWNSAGLLAAIKHYPGHGSSSGDTHDVAGVTPDLATLERSDLVPYRELARLRPAVLVGHLTVPELTDGVPATASRDAIDYLRQTLGYDDALVISDALDMAAADAPVPGAAVAAIAAGIDVVLIMQTTDAGPVIDAILAAVDTGTISIARIDEAAGRVLLELTERGDGCERRAVDSRPAT